MAKGWSMADVDPRMAYLESQVLSAPPQKLRLLLIEAALLRAREAQAAASDQRTDEQWKAGIRCQEILCELLAGIDRTKGDVAQRTYALYAYLLKEATQALRATDPSAWNTLIEVLTLERQTWQMVCQRLAGDGLALAPKQSGNSQPTDTAGGFLAASTATASGNRNVLGSTVAWDA